MCIDRSVGRNAANAFADVKVVQALLDFNGAPQVAVDGRCGPSMQAAIDAFEQVVGVSA